MSAACANVSYDYLPGVSSLAFRMRIPKQGFCPSFPHSFCGYRRVARSGEALPWHVEVSEMKAEDKGKVLEARQAVVDSIERDVQVHIT